MTVDSRDLPGDSDIRESVALSTAGALCNPEDVIKDYGDFDGDVSSKDHAIADGRGDDVLENAVNFFSSQATGTVTIRGSENDED
jgi:hypothetical protein